MKVIKKTISGAILAIGVLFAASFSANAVIIKHDIFADTFGKIGEIEVELLNSALNTGINDSAFDDTISLVSFNLLDIFGWADAFEIFSFEAAIDTDFIEAGIEFFAIDANDIGFPPAETWSYQLLVDAFDPFSSFIDVFDANGDVIFFDSISLGQAELSDLPKPVSAPATLAIFTLAMAALYGRRKIIS
ncbi:MAG: hypothetical protein ACI8ZZ_001836 [Gammaproteobacteria bacterium]|jgi:hypothetical protein